MPATQTLPPPLMPPLAAPGFVAPGFVAPGFVAQGVTAAPPPPGAALAGAALFLRRDLSEQALRQRDAPPAPPPEPMFTRRDLAASREDGFRQGRDTGLAEAAASRAAAETEILGRLATALRDADAAAAGVADTAAAALAGALVAALDAAMPDLLRRAALGEARAMLTHVLPGLSREPRVAVEVPEDLAPGVAAALARLAPDQGDRIAVAGRGDLSPGAVRVRWAGGHAERRPDAVWRGIRDVLAAALAAAPAGAHGPGGDDTGRDDGRDDGMRARETDHGQ